MYIPDGHCRSIPHTFGNIFAATTITKTSQCGAQLNFFYSTVCTWVKFIYIGLRFEVFQINSLQFVEKLNKKVEIISANDQPTLPNQTKLHLLNSIDSRLI